DTSGPYTDPDVRIDIRRGLPALRKAWIEERGDTELLDGPSSAYGRERLNDPKLTAMRFDLRRPPRRAKAGANVTQMHYARRGIITPEMEFVAIRENLRREHYLETLRASGPDGEKLARRLTRQHPGQSFGASIPDVITPEFVRSEVARGRRSEERRVGKGGRDFHVTGVQTCALPISSSRRKWSSWPYARICAANTTWRPCAPAAPTARSWRAA